MHNGKSCNALRQILGFTLIELLVVMAILAILASLVAPRYIGRIDIARETVLQQNLIGLRTIIDQFYRDQDRYPEALDELVIKRYIRAIPQDPITGRTDTWIILPPKDGSKGVFDIRSGALGRARDGSNYAQW